MSPAPTSDPFRILRAAERRAQPWKNGGGVTREVAVHPSGSDLTQFDWRVSIAEIRAPGAFSHFPGIERCMAVLAGRLSLAIGTDPALSLAPDSAPLRFAGETPVFAEPLDGAVTDLNVMTRRGRCECRLQRQMLNGVLQLQPHPGTRLLLALADLKVHAASLEAPLGRWDALLLAGETRCELAAGSADAALYLAEIFVRT